MSNVKLVVTDKSVTVESPFNGIFVEHARRLGGKWDESRWSFDIRELADVKELCMLAFGTDGERLDQVDVEVTVNNDGFYAHTSALTLYGYTLARAFGRDSGAKIMYEGLIIKKGGFDSAGSAKNWCTQAKEGTVFVMRDVSRESVEMFSHESLTVRIVSVNKNSTDFDRAELIKELAEIEHRAKEIRQILES